MSLLAGYDDSDGDVDDNTREFKLHVYGKRQTSDSSWEFLKIENEQIKTAQNNSYGFSLFILPAYEVRRTTDKTAVFEVISGSPGRVLLGVGLCFEVAE